MRLTKAQALAQIRRIYGDLIVLNRDPKAISGARCQAWLPKEKSYIPVALARTWEGVLAVLRKRSEHEKDSDGNQ